MLLSNFTGLRLHFLCPADDDDEEKEKAAKAEENTEAEAPVGGEITTCSDRSPPTNSSEGKGLCYCALCRDVWLLLF